MDIRIIYYVLGRLVMAETITMFIPFAMALWNLESSVSGFAVALGLSASVGLVLQANGRKRETDLSMREGIAITGFGWALATSLGMLPYVCGGLKVFPAFPALGLPCLTVCRGCLPAFFSGV